jgi:hypothetical protein
MIWSLHLNLVFESGKDSPLALEESAADHTEGKSCSLLMTESAEDADEAKPFAIYSSTFKSSPVGSFLPAYACVSSYISSLVWIWRLNVRGILYQA